MTPADAPFRFTDPDHIGESEYRTIYDFCADALADAEPGTEIEFVVAILEQFEDWARRLRQSILSTTDQG